MRPPGSGGPSLLAQALERHGLRIERLQDLAQLAPTPADRSKAPADNGIFAKSALSLLQKPRMRHYK